MRVVLDADLAIGVRPQDNDRGGGPPAPVPDAAPIVSPVPPERSRLPGELPRWAEHGALLALALAWGLGLCAPALLRGELLGQPWTDLYPSVWSLWWGATEGLALHTRHLAWPDGMGFYASSPIKSLIARPLIPLLGVPATFNLLVVAARIGTVLAAGAAARAWGLRGAGALAAAAAFGASPTLHGYAVEGILEGTDGWPLALWAWAEGRGRRGLAAVALFGCFAASWYLGAVALLLLALRAARRPAAAVALLGLCGALPLLVGFISAFPGGAPLDPAVRAAMGAALELPRPGVLPGLHPFAKTAYLGFVLGASALAGRHPAVVLALIPAVLSLGVGPWYELPGMEMIRFPYRWHLGTLALLGLAAGAFADRVGRAGWLVGPLICAEGLLLSPVEPVVPGAPADVPALYAQVDGPVVEVPGPVALPPGQINPSRPRARWVLYPMTRTGQPTPWRPDFNAVGVDPAPRPLDPALDALRAFDAVAGGDGAAPPPELLRQLTAAGVRWAVLHPKAEGAVHLDRLRDALLAQGARLAADDGERWLLELPPG